MARVNIEERAFGDACIRHLAQLMGWDMPKTMGTLVYLWHDSQAALKDEITLRELSLYCYCPDDDEALRLAGAMCEAQILFEVESGVFRVRGNREQIAQLRRYKKRGKAGATARWTPRKRPKKQAQSGEAENASSMLQASDTHAKSISMQCNSMQSNAVEEEGTPATSKLDESVGAIAEFQGVAGAEILDTVKQRAQRAWLKTFGADVIRSELPMAYQRWQSNDQRSQFGNLPLFLSHWFTRALKEAKSRPAPSTHEKTPAGGIPAWELEANRRAEAEREKIVPADKDKVRALVKQITGGP